MWMPFLDQVTQGCFLTQMRGNLPIHGTPHSRRECKKKQPDMHKKRCDDTKSLRSKVGQPVKENEMDYPREISHRAFP